MSDTLSKYADTLNALDQMQSSPVYAVRKYVLAAAERIIVDLETELTTCQAELAAVRELLSIHNLGGMTDYNDGPMKRALAAERRLAELEKRCVCQNLQNALKTGGANADE